MKEVPGYEAWAYRKFQVDISTTNIEQDVLSMYNKSTAIYVCQDDKCEGLRGTRRYPIPRNYSMVANMLPASRGFSGIVGSKPCSFQRGAAYSGRPLGANL